MRKGIGGREARKVSETSVIRNSYHKREQLIKSMKASRELFK